MLRRFVGGKLSGPTDGKKIRGPGCKWTKGDNTIRDVDMDAWTVRMGKIWGLGMQKISIGTINFTCIFPIFSFHTTGYSSRDSTNYTQIKEIW